MIYIVGRIRNKDSNIIILITYSRARNNHCKMNWILEM